MVVSKSIDLGHPSFILRHQIQYWWAWWLYKDMTWFEFIKGDTSPPSKIVSYDWVMPNINHVLTK